MTIEVRTHCSAECAINPSARGFQVDLLPVIADGSLAQECQFLVLHFEESPEARPTMAPTIEPVLRHEELAVPGHRRTHPSQDTVRGRGMTQGDGVEHRG